MALGRRDQRAKPAAKAYRLSDSGSMWVTPSGGKLWRWAYVFQGKEKLMALGKYPVVSLSTARNPQNIVPLARRPSRFRGLASTILHEHGYSHEHTELQLAHAPRNAVSAAYHHALHLKARAKMTGRIVRSEALCSIDALRNECNEEENALGMTFTSGWLIR